MSYYPLILSAGLTIAMAGLMTSYWVIALGGILMIWGLIGWSLEPVNDPMDSH